MIKIIIADDHKLIRDGLRKMCESEMDLTVAAETEDPFEVISLIQNTEFDILLLDINFPQKSGLELLKDLKLLKPEIKVLMLSMHPEERYAIRTLKAGASGYISKDSDPKNIIAAIRKIHTGRKYLSSELSDQLLDGIDTDDKPFYEKLSDREFQVLRFLAEGKSQTDIAEELAISISTVNTYRSRVMEKLKLNSNADLIHYCIENKLID